MGAAKPAPPPPPPAAGLSRLAARLPAYDAHPAAYATGAAVLLPLLALRLWRAFRARPKVRRRLRDASALPDYMAPYPCVVVTGASGDGVGSLTLAAARAAFPEAVVYGTSRRGVPPAEGVAAADAGKPAAERRGPPPLLKLDVGSEASVALLVEAVAAAHGGRIDAIVNNAGSTLASHADRTAPEATLALFETNVFGPMRVVRHARPYLVPGCVVVNVGSAAGTCPIPYQSMYSSAKAALDRWTLVLRMEYSLKSVGVTLVVPGDLRHHMACASEGPEIEADPVAKKAVATMRKDEDDGTDPAVVARACLRAVRLGHEAPGVILVGPDAWLVRIATGFLPQAVAEWLIMQHYGM
jgi:NAD(P)-dependent dehydrogenase (short-subunit alcohol dehydrogenase family)